MRRQPVQLKGSKTEQNLLTAFAGESQARNRYTYFASQARKEGFEQICAIFTETADNEKEHAKVFFKYLEGGEVKIEWPFPAGGIGDTAANTEAGAAGGRHGAPGALPRLQARTGALRGAGRELVAAASSRFSTDSKVAAEEQG